MSDTGYFWQQKSLAEMTHEEWESLCDGCGKCCLHKLMDEDDDTVYYTQVACKQLDITQCRCNDYPNRKKLVPDCIELSIDDIDQFDWLPKTCAYRLVNEDKPLPPWHHLITGDPKSIHKARESIKGRAISEHVVLEEDLELHIIKWVE